MKNKFSMAISLAIIIAMLVASLALADNLNNDVANNGIVTIIAGDSTTITYQLVGNKSPKGDPDDCDATSANPVTVTITKPGTVSGPTSFSFEGCGPDFRVEVTFSSDKAGEYDITHSIGGGVSGSKFNNNADFSLVVNAVTPTNNPPTLTLPDDIANEATSADGAGVSFEVTAFDEEDGELTPTCEPESGFTFTFPLGTTQVDCSVTDSDGATISGMFNVTVQDTTPPDVTVPADIKTEAIGPDGAAVTFDVSAYDLVDGALTPTCDYESGSTFALDTITTITCLATDAHYNTGSASFTVIVQDTTPPTITLFSRLPAANGNGWNNSGLTVTWNCTDLVGVKAPTVSATVLTEGENQSITGTCEDTSGNKASAIVSDINIDKTTPTASASASPAPNANGWNNTDVMVSFNGNDGTGSGIDFCDAAVVVSGEGVGQSASGTCTDKAGNVSAPATVSGINIDKTAPVFGACPTRSNPFILGSGLQSVGPITVDASISGLYASTLSGYVDTSSIGPKTVSFNATDNAGNSDSKACSYSVIYNWTGFFQPVDMNAVNTVKAGSAIPVKFNLGGNQGLNIFELGYPKFVKTSCTSGTEDAIETTVTAGGSSLTYDALAGQYIYVWKTEKSWVGLCGRLEVKLNDGTLHVANFKFK